MIKICTFLLLAFTVCPGVYAEEAVQPDPWAIVHSNVPVQGAVLYTVKAGDTLDKIARQYGTTIELIKIRNKLSGHGFRPGQKLSVWSVPFLLRVNKAMNRLDVEVAGRVIHSYPVSTGKTSTQTPLGEFTIKHRYPNPTWFNQGKAIPGGDKENHLGTRWLGFDKPKYGIHGTHQPELIGQAVSHGCVRMKNEDVEELYDVIPMGTKVIIEENNSGPRLPDGKRVNTVTPIKKGQ